MHGLIFTAFRQYCWTRVEEHSEEISRGLPNYVMTASYPDEDFDALVARVMEVTRRSRRDILVDFGRFTGFWVFRVMRGDYYEESANTHTFLLDVECCDRAASLHAPRRRRVLRARDPNLSHRLLFR